MNCEKCEKNPNYHLETIQINVWINKLYTLITRTYEQDHKRKHQKIGHARLHAMSKLIYLPLHYVKKHFL